MGLGAVYVGHNRRPQQFSILPRSQNRFPSLGQGFLAAVFGRIEYSMDCEDTAAVVLAFFARCGGDPMGAACLGANLGGDTDTIGALAAAICGAYSGTAKLDMDLIRQIEEVNHVNFLEKAVSILNV